MVNNDKSYYSYNRTKIGIFFVSPTLWGVKFHLFFFKCPILVGICFSRSARHEEKLVSTVLPVATGTCLMDYMPNFTSSRHQVA